MSAPILVPALMPAVVADLRAADRLLGHAATALRAGGRLQLADATELLALSVGIWAGLLQAQHERIAAHAAKQTTAQYRKDHPWTP